MWANNDLGEPTLVQCNKGDTSTASNFCTLYQGMPHFTKGHPAADLAAIGEYNFWAQSSHADGTVLIGAKYGPLTKEG
jgi:hypothetical protein